MKKLTVWLILLMLIVPSAVWSGKKIDVSSSATTKTTVKPVLKVAIVPITFLEEHKPCNNKTAPKTTKNVINDLLHLANLEIVDDNAAAFEWSKYASSNDPNVLPAQVDLIGFGRALGVDYVITGITDWHIKTPWVALGPKTKAVCTVNALIIDVRKANVVTRATDVISDSTNREQLWQTATAIFLGWKGTLVSGGPKTPHMERAGGQAWSLVLKPFLETKISPEKLKELNEKAKTNK
jgi:TolB-like protein